MTATAVEIDRARQLAERFIEFLLTGQAPVGLFAPSVFADVSMPTWRLQGATPSDLVAIRVGGHPALGTVPRYRFDPTPTGFVLEWEESWRDAGQDWYCREMCRADVGPEGISTLSVYCTGDWDEARVREHRDAVTLLRP